MLAAGCSVRAALAAGSAQLGGDAAARFDASLLLRTALGRDGAWLIANANEVLDGTALERYRRALERRGRGEPVAYITGESWFYGRRFEVSPAVLVPRPETEQLLEAVLNYLDARRLEAPRVCEVGTGSGILAVSLASERGLRNVVALERSPAALALARRNAASLGVDGCIDFRLSDVFAALDPTMRFDCIVANLPYVRSADLAAAPDPTSFEPRLALDGGADGLAVYRRLVDEARERLAHGGGLFLEAGPDTAPGLASLAARSFPSKKCAVLRDYAGLERIVTVTG